MCRPNKVRCFKCFEWFDKEKQKVEQCKKCGDFKCPLCSACMCDLTKEEKRVVMAMIHTYENFLNEKYGEDYDFEVHERVEKELG
ncbi:MAG: hypothetical protein ABIA78_02580 [archaeon]